MQWLSFTSGSCGDDAEALNQKLFVQQGF